ncbi:hypothetical protein BE15_32700 [Sorangium cellulosum]|uniref:Uncharacterized protein n=1 Tax=Sorangium cellulosum TaxID=56 RepID=A0A150PZV6_SORCE|nr:hypothetical protein BE15_32700 [Sorangium cellulosum]
MTSSIGAPSTSPQEISRNPSCGRTGPHAPAAICAVSIARLSGLAYTASNAGPAARRRPSASASCLPCASRGVSVHPLIGVPGPARLPAVRPWRTRIKRLGCMAQARAGLLGASLARAVARASAWGRLAPSRAGSWILGRVSAGRAEEPQRHPAQEPHPQNA